MASLEGHNLLIRGMASLEGHNLVVFHSWALNISEIWPLVGVAL
jgi:hypothetical protein